MRDALGFLTVLPLGRQGPPTGWGLLAFPLVGALVGGAWALTAWTTDPLGGPLVAAAAVLVVDLLLTGGLHLDAVADVADAVGSRRRGDAAREVLADPAIGAIGAAGLGSVLFLRFALLAAVIPHGPIALLGAPAAGRAAMVWATGRMPHGPGSLGSDLHAVASRPVATAVAVTAAVIGGLAAGSVATGLATLVLVVVTAEGASAWWKRRYGFPSGDAIGATGSAAETLVLVVLAAQVAGS